MKTFLGVMAVLIVSGATDVTVQGTIGDSVVLPCICSDRNLRNDLKWQKEGQHVVVHHTSKFSDSYMDRAKIFVSPSSRDCSLHLSNITAVDQGTYRCSFKTQGKYNFSLVHLNISANYHLCQAPPKTVRGDVSGTLFQCEVEGRYSEAEIQWILEEKLLTNSPTINITNSRPVLNVSGVYLFRSTLITHSSLTLEPKCVVKTKAISPNVSKVCKDTSGFFIDPSPESQYSMFMTVIIPILLVLGLSLFLWRCYDRKKNNKAYG